MLWNPSKIKMIKGLIVALQFLTRLPVNIQVDFNKENIAKGTLFFPFVGMIVGSIAALTYHLLSYINNDIAAVGAVLAIIFTTGGLHLDGLSDTCDGFFSARDRERILEIMKDSRAGTFGVIGVVVDILLKYVIISNISKGIIMALIISSGCGRLAAVFLISFTKSARPGGLGDMFSGSKPKKYAVTGAVIFILAALIINPVNIIPIISGLFAAFLVAVKSYKTIGGLTGDVYGAAIEIVEITSLFAFMGASIWI